MYGQIERLSDKKVQLAKEMYEAVDGFVRNNHEKNADAEGSREHFKKIYLHMPDQQDDPIYCTCKQMSFGKMISCENPSCEIEWFHYSCVGLSKEPEGEA
ncbi:hypothetical protein OSTOST_01027, partial [Ostertagia ostertagi]